VVAEESAPRDVVRASELVATLCLATDLAMGFPLEHGLHSTLVAMRVADRLGVDARTAHETYYGCLLCYAGCTADAEVAAEIFAEGALLEHFTPVAFGAPGETLRGIVRALAAPHEGTRLGLARGATRLPGASRGRRRHIDALCQVAQMLSRRMGMPDGVTAVVGSLTERWDGKGLPNRERGEGLPLALRIAHVARDATFQALVSDAGTAAEVIRRRGGGAFDPQIADLVADDFGALVGSPPRDCWNQVLEREPKPVRMLREEQVDAAITAMADFTDLVSPFLAGHSSGVAGLASRAAAVAGLPDAQIAAVRRAGFLHDLGRVAVPARIWTMRGPLAPAEWEQVRLHPYYTERLTAPSALLADLGRIAGHHHERLDGSGYYRGETAVSLTVPQRLLAAADAFHAKTEPRAFRPAFSVASAAAFVHDEARSGRLDSEAVHAVVEAAGLRPEPVTRPAGLTDREAQVVGLLARGLQTKQIARALGVSAKTADRHIQNCYAKMGVSTRAAAAVFAMQHGLVAWGELPMVGDRSHS
jgi:HD-GYP domain-containing protein (c-di-GMP phosphodiesterase class II)